MEGTLIFERGERVYLVGPVSPFEPSDEELAELAFGEDARKMAPNQMLWWLRGQYVEAEKANKNGALWSSDELAIKSLSPLLMPVTVMHDPRTAVGMIADTKLLTPETASVPRSRIDTTLGLWRHRFPDVCEEAAVNYQAGTLMQSMECLPAYYDCGECGKRYPKLPGGAEEVNWCAHLRGESASAANGAPIRRLGNVTFTGTGLIFGTRGAKGAYDEAHLDVFQEEVAEFHERVHTDSRTSRRRARNMDKIEIDRSEYDALKAKASTADELAKQVSTLEPEAAKVPDLASKLESEETARKAAETERDELKTKVDAADETARAKTLSTERFGKLGSGFKSKLGEFTRGRLEDQAGTLSDEDWENRLKELEETAKVKRDDGEVEAGAGGEGDTFTREETARSAAGNGGGGSGSKEPTETQRRSVVAGLVPKA